MEAAAFKTGGVIGGFGNFAEAENRTAGNNHHVGMHVKRKLLNYQHELIAELNLEDTWELKSLKFVIGFDSYFLCFFDKQSIILMR